MKTYIDKYTLQYTTLSLLICIRMQGDDVVD